MAAFLREACAEARLEELAGDGATAAGATTTLDNAIDTLGRLLGVLDLDSPTPARFSEQDARGLERLVVAFCELTDTP